MLIKGQSEAGSKLIMRMTRRTHIQAWEVKNKRENFKIRVASLIKDNRNGIPSIKPGENIAWAFLPKNMRDIIPYVYPLLIIPTLSGNRGRWIEMRWNGGILILIQHFSLPEPLEQAPIVMAGLVENKSELEMLQNNQILEPYTTLHVYTTGKLITPLRHGRNYTVTSQE